MENPTYEDVIKGTSGHLEVVQIEFDSAIFSYEKLLEIYWMQIDPTLVIDILPLFVDGFLF